MIIKQCFMRAGGPRETIGQLATRALDIARRTGDALLTAMTMYGQVIESYSHGRQAEARALCGQMLELGQEEQSRRISAMGLGQLAFVNLFARKPEEAIDCVRQAVR